MTTADLNAMYPEGEWQILMADWQQSRAVVCEVSKDIAQLRKLKYQVQMKTLRMVSMVSLDVVMVLIGNAIWAYAMTKRTSFLFSSFCIAMIVMNTTWLFYSIWYRGGTWKATGIDSLSFLRLTRRRAEAGVQIAKAMVYWCVAVLVMVEIYLLIFGVIEWRSEAEFPFKLFYLFLFEAVWIIGSIYMAKYYGTKKKKEMDRLSLLIGDLDQVVHE